MDLRVERTQRMLCDAFEELIAEKPYEQIRVSELCDRATIRRATFYTHFPDKDAFFGFYVSRIRSELSVSVLAGGEDMPLGEYCRQMTRAFVHVLKERESQLAHLRLGPQFDGLLAMVADEIAGQVAPLVRNYLHDAGMFGDGLENRARWKAVFYANGLVGMVRWMSDPANRNDVDDALLAFDSMSEEMFPTF